MRQGFVFCLLFSVVLAGWNQSSRQFYLTFLEDYTRPARYSLSTENSGEEISVSEFFASDSGISFLLQTADDLQDLQKTLEEEYDRGGKCRNLKKAKRKRTLDSSMDSFKKCVCDFSQPFLHCLSLGSQILKKHETISVNMRSSEFQRQATKKLQHFRNAPSPEACNPKPYEYLDQQCFGGHCEVPIGHLLRIKMNDAICIATKGLIRFDASICEICQRPAGPCTQICEDYILEIATLVEDSSAQLTTEVCLEFGRVSILLGGIFGDEYCFHGSSITMHMFQRLLTLTSRWSNSGVQLNVNLDYKYVDGPSCYCKLIPFHCMQSCKMKSEEVKGILSIQWDLFFAEYSMDKVFNEPQECFTEFAEHPSPCTRHPTAKEISFVSITHHTNY